MLWSISRWFHSHRLTMLARVVKGINFYVNSTLLPFQAKVGRGVVVEHHGLGVVIHPNVTIGDGVQIWHNVTIAAETEPGSPYRVRIGDHVVLGAGSIVIARTDRGLTIGAGARVGAGAVVTHDLPAGAVVVGNPAVAVKASLS